MPNSNILPVSPLANLPSNVVVNYFCVPCTDVRARLLGTAFALCQEICWDCPEPSDLNALGRVRYR